MAHRSVLAQLVATTLLLAGSVQAQDPNVSPQDWPFWRGPEANGISRVKNLPSTWSPEGENLVWKSSELATRCTPVVFKGRIYTISRFQPDTKNEGERVVCADAATGKVLWEHAYNIFLTDAPSERIGWSSPIVDPATGRVYTLGLCSVFTCLDGETGEVIWERSMSEEFGLLSTYGGRTHYPVLFENLIIISGVMTGWGEYAVPAHRYIAFDKATGQAVWLTSTRLRPEDTTFSCPIATVLDGEAALIAGAGDGSVYALQPRTGKVIWQFDISGRGINNTPLVVGDTAYISHEEFNIADPTTMGGLYAINGIGSGNITQTNLRWLNTTTMVGRAQPLLVGDRLYGVENGGTVRIIDVEDGSDIGRFKVGRIIFGSPTYADGKIYIGENSGNFFILEPTETGLRQLSRVRLPDEEVFGSPIVADGRVYLPTTSNLYCIAQPGAKLEADPLPAPLVETPSSADQTPAQLQLAPVEVLMRPGQKQPLQARLYNAAGRYLKTAKDAVFAVKGQGSVDEAGVFSLPPDAKRGVTFITAKFGELTGQARVRIVPPLPWSFDFNDKLVPAEWIGASYRHQPRELDGEQVLAKLTTIPKGTRSQAWFGHPDLHDYTNQFDFRCALGGDKLPDVGLINQRYILDCQGTYQQLQIRTWGSSLFRFTTQTPFSFRDGVWYTMKFRAETHPGANSGSKIVKLMGKVWERGTTEPTEWSIAGEDEFPNLKGSPGMFGNATNAEIYIDNVKVTPNASDEESSKP
jgi:outer membrane protein assembly factor BamB